MAGHRRGTGRPRRVDAHPVRQKRTIDERIADTNDPRQRISIAFDAFRMKFSELSLADQRAAARRVVSALRKMADDLTMENK